MKKEVKIDISKKDWSKRFERAINKFRNGKLDKLTIKLSGNKTKLAYLNKKIMEVLDKKK